MAARGRQKNIGPTANLSFSSSLSQTPVFKGLFRCTWIQMRWHGTLICFQIRRMMIDGATGERTIHTLVKSQDEVRARIQMCFRSPPTGSVCCKMNVFKLSIVVDFFFAVLHPRQRYIDRGVRTYTWAPVNGTDYRWAFSAVFSVHCEKNHPVFFPVGIIVTVLLQPGSCFAKIQWTLHSS